MFSHIVPEDNDVPRVCNETPEDSETEDKQEPEADLVARGPTDSTAGKKKKRKRGKKKKNKTEAKTE